MKRILFVDDEQRILDGLRRLLRDKRAEWEMVFVDGGSKALEQLRASPFDIVITDMRMPGMDGATLLTHVKEEFPDVVRLVLSGCSDPEDGGRLCADGIQPGGNRHHLQSAPAARHLLCERADG